MTGKPAKKVLHVLGDKSWKPQYKFLGSTKDIVGRRDYFASRGIEFIELQVKGRHDNICLDMLKGMDLKDVDAVLMEHPRYPRSMAYLRRTYPDIRLLIRGHNAELIHQWHTVKAYLHSGVGNSKWRWKRARMTAKNLFDRFWFDLSCARHADFVLAISDWEAEHYWPRLVGHKKVLASPYFVPESYIAHPPENLHKVHRVLCTMSADWTPLAHDAAVVLVDVVSQKPKGYFGGWKFMITGDLGKHRDSYKSLKSGGRVTVAGNVADPFKVMMESRVLAHLSNLGMGFKTKLMDFVSCGGWILMQKTLYDRQPEEIRPFCIVVDPLTPESLYKALQKAKEPWPSNEGVNERLRARAFAALDKALGYA